MNLRDMTPDERYAAIKEIRRVEKLRLEKQEVDMWKNLKPFNEPGGFVPELPRDLTPYHMNRLIACGAIEKKALQDGVWYFGDYRTAKFGLWDAEKGHFKIQRFKFGQFMWDTCYHFQDDDGFALFVPIREATAEEKQEEDNKQ